VKRLGCLTVSGFVTTLVTLLIVVGAGLARGGVLFSPGRLNAQPGRLIGGSRSHVEIPACATCHAPFWAKERMADRCLACHTELMADAQDFHRVMLAESQKRSCRGCHTDHNGASASLTITNLGDFPHEAVGFSLHAHRRMTDGVPFTCSDCHTSSFSQMDLAICEDCHRNREAGFMQSHVSTFGGDCLTCHDGLDTYGKSFDHNHLAFPLQGNHAPLACAECHPAARTLTDLQATKQDCRSCHAEDDPHGGRFGQDCAQCHTPEGWKPAQFDHSLADFPLLGKHSAVACEQCHREGVFAGTPQDCFSCHAPDDPHGGRFGQDCAQCHIPEGWKPAKFDHSLAAFPLIGKHSAVACEQCHREGVFAGTPQDCFSCHAPDDPHGGQFGQECAACHTPEGWQPATFDHSRSAFPLTGAHANLDCQQCHANGVFIGTPTQCIACHAEPSYHAGLFGTDCAACHTTSAWTPAQFNGPHTFPINHGRVVSSCRVCHPSRLSAYTCYGCHEHTQANIKAKHQEEGISNFTNCVRCHPTGREEGD
jgi:hypothetical protein